MEFQIESTIIEAKKCLELIYDNYTDEYNELNLIKDKSESIKIFKLLETPGQYEVIEVSEQKEKAKNTIGFDIGWDSFYSIIADTVITPIWHPPDIDKLDKLIEFLKCLNSNCLFNSYDDAQKFSSFYRTQDWAEKENGYVFKIIQIRDIKV